MKDLIIKERVIKHEINKVWNAISNGKELSTWFIQADFKPEVGYLYTFTSTGEKCAKINGLVKKATPYTLIYSWIVEGTDIETEVKWVLETVKEGTKIHLEHSGISKYSGETAIQMFINFDGGWDNCINDLSKYLIEILHAG